MYMTRLVLAAMLVANDGNYRPTFELLEHVRREPGSEAYRNSEKYQLRIGMADRMRTQFETDTLSRHLEIQRWYASKGTALERARLVDHASVG